MAKTETFETSVAWTGGHRGHLKLGNGPEMDFAAPPASHGEAGVLTPEDAFVGAVNTCVMLMFIWAAERFRLDLVSYECRAEGTKRIELDRTEIFTRVVMKPRIVVRARNETAEAIEKRVRRALESAQKFSLVANSVKSKVIIEPEIAVERPGGRRTGGGPARGDL
jgi:organic hydroperoxide reductase OsmC/OhrA